MYYTLRPSTKVLLEPLPSYFGLLVYPTDRPSCPSLKGRPSVPVVTWSFLCQPTSPPANLDTGPDATDSQLPSFSLLPSRKNPGGGGEKNRSRYTGYYIERGRKGNVVLKCMIAVSYTNISTYVHSYLLLTKSNSPARRSVIPHKCGLIIVEGRLHSFSSAVGRPLSNHRSHSLHVSDD